MSDKLEIEKLQIGRNYRNKNNLITIKLISIDYKKSSITYDIVPKKVAKFVGGGQLELQLFLSNYYLFDSEQVIFKSKFKKFYDNLSG